MNVVSSLGPEATQHEVRGPHTGLASDRRGQEEEHRPAFSKRFRAKDGRGEEERSPASLLSPLFQQFHQLQHPPTPPQESDSTTAPYGQWPCFSASWSQQLGTRGTWTVWSQHLATIEIQSLGGAMMLQAAQCGSCPNSEAAKTCPRSQRWWKRFSQDAWPHFQRSAKAKLVHLT